jgi:hypothetical protein
MDQASASRELSSPQAKTAKDSSLLDLPQGVLALIISFSAPNSKRQHPLLAVCRATRDAVLQTLQELTLKFEGVLRIPPLAGLLHRACCAARAGLTIILQCQSAWADAVLQLGVQHLSNDSLGVEHTGWDRVHTLVRAARARGRWPRVSVAPGESGLVLSNRMLILSVIAALAQGCNTATSPLIALNSSWVVSHMWLVCLVHFGRSCKNLIGAQIVEECVKCSFRPQ